MEPIYPCDFICVLCGEYLTNCHSPYTPMGLFWEDGLVLLSRSVTSGWSLCRVGAQNTLCKCPVHVFQTLKFIVKVRLTEL